MPLVEYKGNFSDLFKIYIVNVLLVLVTLGLYYPWAKVKLLRYHYGETEMNGTPFVFHGTGKEVFKGFLVVILVYGLLSGIEYLIQHYGVHGDHFMWIIWGNLIVLLLVLSFVPAAIVGSLKYRTSRSSWRGIHFSYHGSSKAMFKQLLSFLLVIVTFGIYYPWFIVKIFRHIISHVRFGNLKAKFIGSGTELFLTILIGVGLLFVTALMAGLLSFVLPPFIAPVLPAIAMFFVIFFLQAKISNFFIDNMSLKKGEERGKMKGSLTATGLIKLMFVNGMIILFTLGLGIPLAIIRTKRYYTSCLSIQGNIDFDSLAQGDIEEISATGDSFLDFFEIDII